MSYVRHRGLAEQDARDVVQEVFATLVRTMPNFELDRSRGRFRTWLWRVTHNAMIDWSRRRQCRAAAEDEARKETPSAVAAEEPDAEAEFLAAHRRRILQFVLEQIRSRSNAATWQCFDLHILQGRPSAAVAAELGLTSNAVYVNASRILARVAEQCAEYAEDLDEE